MASLRRHQTSRYWYACYTDGLGRRAQRSTKQADRKRAQKVAEQYERAAAQARAGYLGERQARKVIGAIYEIANREPLRSDSIRDFFTRWLTRVKVESSPKTFQRYGGITARFLAWLGPRADLAVAHLTSVEIVAYRDHLARKHSPSSVNLSLATIQAALSRAFDDRLVDVNEAARVPRLGDDPRRKQQRRAFTHEELRAILAACDTEWRGMVLVGAYCGARLGDIAVLRWQDVDLEGREMHFKTAKTGRQQSIPIAEPLYRHLLEVAGVDDPRAPLFPRAHASRQRDIPTGNLSEQFYRIMARVGIVPPRNHKSAGKGRDAARGPAGLGFHCLRHTATTLLKEAGVSDAVAREIVGHESAAVSRAYSHIDAAVLKAAVERLRDIT